MYENVKDKVLPRFRALLCRGLQSSVPGTKNEPEASEVLQLPHGIIIMSQIKFDDSMTKRNSRSFQNAVQGHQKLRLPQKMTSKTSHFDSRLPRGHADEKVSAVLHPSRKTTVETATCPESAMPAMKNWHSSKNEHGALRASKTRPLEERSPWHPVCASLHSRNAHGHLTRELLCCKGHQICRTRMGPPRMNTRPYRKNPKCGHCVWVNQDVSGCWTGCLGEWLLITIQGTCLNMATAHAYSYHNNCML